MSSTESTNTRWPKPPRVNLWRWLSPLLLVSLGLHGVGLLVPVPEEAEILEPEELEEEVVSIQVSELPPGAIEPEPSPTAEPPPPPVEETLPPEPIAPPPESEIFPVEEPSQIFEFEEIPLDETPGDEIPGDEIPGDETPGDETPGDETPGDETPGDETPSRESFTSAGTGQGGVVGGEGGLSIFSQAVLEHEIVKQSGIERDKAIPGYIREAYSLTYTGERCPEKEVDSLVAIGVLMPENAQDPVLLQLLNSTGYPETLDTAIREWARYMAGEEELFDDLKIVEKEALYNWLRDQASSWFDDGKPFEAYYFPITIELGAQCTQQS